MAIIESTSARAIAAGGPATPSATFGVLRRPVETTGWKSWLFTIDHKKLGIMYGAVALFFLIVGGLEALLIRAQLMLPNGKVLNADIYNQMFTMHATTMVFLFGMPLAAAFGNYFVPLQIGARDVAFPRLNAFGFWCFLMGGLFLNLSWFLGGAADGGWTMYLPNSSVAYSPTNGVDFWGLGVQITGIASLTGSVNLIVTILNMRAPGMKLMRMPIFTWMILVVQFLLAFSLPVITVALFMLMFSRSFGAAFFATELGADPLLWQHLFWIFGHPEVYILVLPAFGVVSEVLPTFSRKPLFGYPLVVFSGAAIGTVGFLVWAHHMFASGMGPISVAIFSVATMAIAVPTGVKIVNWTMTMWGGKLTFPTPMLFAVGLILQFTLGGLSGVTHANAAADLQQHDTYYIVAHFHYVLMGGMVLGLFSGLYFWWPKMFGRKLHESWGKWNFWTMIVGINLTFGPQHILGLQGQPRRMFYHEARLAGEGPFNLVFWNFISSIGSFVLAIGFLFFFINVARSHWGKKQTEPCGADPWNARTLEWMTSSPPKEYNFPRVPVIHHLDEFFHRKYKDEGTGGRHDYVEVATGDEVVAEEEAHKEAHIHLPSPSYWPLVLAVSMPILAAGVIYDYILIAVGAAVALLALFGWVLEPATANDADFDPPAQAGTDLEVATP